MSTPEQHQERSSVAISQNAKGEPQVTVKVYDGTEAGEVARIRLLAVTAYRDTVAEVRS